MGERKCLNPASHRMECECARVAAAYPLPNPADLADWPTLAAVVREYVIAACERCSWNLTKAAGVLGVSVKTCYNHMRAYEEQGYVEHPGKRWQRVGKR